MPPCRCRQMLDEPSHTFAYKSNLCALCLRCKIASALTVQQANGGLTGTEPCFSVLEGEPVVQISKTFILMTIIRPISKIPVQGAMS